jgi:hypothetical protein
MEVSRAVISGGFAVIGAAYTAPRNRGVVAIISATIYMVASGTLVTLVLIFADVLNLQAWWDMALMVASGGAAAYAAKEIYGDEKTA